MNINFKDLFNPIILKRGYDYYRENKVSNIDVSSNQIFGIVNGKENYFVTIDLFHNKIDSAECTCPYDNPTSYCKHIAAVLYYVENMNNKEENNYNLNNIINKINEKELKEFLLNILNNDNNLLNEFRSKFINYFPKLSYEEYERKIYAAIRDASGGSGYIDYDSISIYSHNMYNFIYEANKAIKEYDYATAFNIAKIILKSITRIDIDDSYGTVGDIADDCINILYSILIKSSFECEITKNILNFILDEVRTGYISNYGVEITVLLDMFINNNLYLKDIEKTLLDTLKESKKKDYFYKRYDYIMYLYVIYTYSKELNKREDLLKEYSFDEKVCLFYIDYLLEKERINEAIKIIKDNIKITNSFNLKNKLSEIYLKNKMFDEYKTILYDILYSDSRDALINYKRIKKLYNEEQWAKEKIIIIDKLKKLKYYFDVVNNIYVEEKMYNELFLSIKYASYSTITSYEKYLLKDYYNELISIYISLILNDANQANNRKMYSSVASKAKHLIDIDKSKKGVNYLFKELYGMFRKKPAMLEEFNKIIDISKYCML